MSVEEILLLMMYPSINDLLVCSSGFVRSGIPFNDVNYGTIGTKPPVPSDYTNNDTWQTPL